MRRAVLTLIAALLLAAPASAGAAFGFKEVKVDFSRADGSAATEAGTHPFAMRTTLDFNTVFDPDLGKEVLAGEPKDLTVELPPGFAGDPRAVPRCSNADFLLVDKDHPNSSCPDGSAVGFLLAREPGETGGDAGSAFNLVPPPGAAAKLGFIVLGVPVTISVGVNPNPPYNVVATLGNVSNAVAVGGSDLVLWGTPADPVHDQERGLCFATPAPDSCPVNIPERPFITLPRSCSGPLVTTFRARSWFDSGTLVQAQAPSPETTGCPSLGFGPLLSAKPSSDHAESPSGLAVDLDVDDEGLLSPKGTAQSDIKKVVLTLPEGMTANPSLAEGLGVCTPAAYAQERADAEPGEGCPQSAKIGTIEVETPLLEGEVLKGDVFVAEPYNNPFGSLIALYMVIRDRELGILVKQAGKVEPDPRTGQLRTIFDDLPQFPLGQVRVRLREGGRSPLITPPSCGVHTAVVEFTPWANPAKAISDSSPFQITKGVGGGPCPPAGPPPFAPGFEAGTLNNEAGSFSPFYMRLTRRDGDQDMTKFSSVLPRGLLGRLAGLSQCPEAAIAAARAKNGRQELAAPSCPADSRIGRTVAGAGVGSQLTYVPGSLYLAGPVGKNPLSVVAITPAVAGPFDAGTVVVRVALRLHPRTAQAEVDGANSDPIPHILQGIVLKVRDLRVYADRERFTLNPTSCAPSEVQATLFGSFLDVFNAADDAPVSLADRFQAANCRNLGFKPRLTFRLKGGTKRGDHPALRAVLRPRPGDANLSRTEVRLPRSAFLENAHIRTICTRVQFAAENCPKGAVYGRVTAFSPLLDKPLRGPAYLRSSDNELPDLVFDLHGIVDIESSARIDSIKGGIRATFPFIPDAPLSKVVVDMFGGKKGLIVNSRNLCASKSRATLRLRAHNGRQRELRPVVRPAGCKRD